ncbi:MAG: 30S ribosomal protein S1 [Candidatus Cloacimonetes bacterium]|nr:30S ribosomal protein S1 [Candidatus Cloacimonadota bacterium]
MSKASVTSMQDLLASSDFLFQSLHRGDVVEGKILSVTDKEALVDVGAKAEGILPQREIKDLNLKVGDRLLVYVLTPEDKEGQILLSIKRAQGARAWLELEKASQTGKILSAEITGHNKGGLIVMMQGVQAFIPFSHLVSAPDPNLPRPELQSALDKMRGMKLSVKVIELNREKDRIILSERDAVEERELARKVEELEKFKPGQKVNGVITAVMPYGLEVDVNGVAALIPQDEISWEEKTGQLAEFSVGQEVSAEVLQLKKTIGRLTLSIKKLIPDPWEELVRKFKPGKKVKGEITKITSFGVFVKVAKEIEGLLPLSALSEGKTDVKVGDKLDVAVKAIDKENRRLELSV